MLAGRHRDAVVAAVASLVPGAVKISARGENGWRIVFRPARFERLSLTDGGRGSVPMENAPAGLAARLVRDVSGLLRHSDTHWPGLTSSSAAGEVTVSEDGLQVIVSDDAGHRAESPLIALWTSVERECRARARAEIGRLGQADAPAQSRYVSMQLARLLLADDGHLRRNAWAQSALRVAAFCDLVFLGRFWLINGVWQLDPQPIDIPHLDHLLDALAVGGERDLDDWIGAGPDLLDLIKDHFVAAGTWRRHVRRLPGASPTMASVDDPDNLGLDAVRLVLSEGSATQEAPTPELTALAGCALIGRVINDQELITPQLIDAAGPASDVLGAGFDWAARRRRAADLRRTASIGDPGPAPGYWG